MTEELDSEHFSWGRTLRQNYPSVLAAIPVVMIPALEWLPWIEDKYRPWLILPSLAAAAVGLILIGRRRMQFDDVLRANRQLKQSIEKAEPEFLLQQIAGTLFRQGAWRLTVYKKEHVASQGIGDHLVRVVSVASDKDQRDLGAKMILIRPSLFQHLFESNLADPRFRRSEESGSFPGDVHSEEWRAWHEGVFGDSANVVNDESTFRARKLAWYAAQDPISQTLIAVIAESADVDGIEVDILNHTLTPAWMFFAFQLADLRTASNVSVRLTS